jgi:hypothetical protein
MSPLLHSLARVYAHAGALGALLDGTRPCSAVVTIIPSTARTCW